MAADLTLADRARRALLTAGFLPDFPEQAAVEIRAIEQMPLPSPTNLSHLLWSSIDNEETRDLDQLEYAEPGPNGSIRLLLAIADVATYVQPGSAIDQRAAHNTVSIYTAGKTFHLLPEELSTRQTSLVEDELRLAVVVDMMVERDGEVYEPKVYPARVRNHARLTYEGVGNWIESGNPLLEFPLVPALKEQLSLQLEASERFVALRRKMGALTFPSSEAQPIVKEGKVIDLQLRGRNRARDLIESLMIAANVATASFLKGRGFPIIERAVRAPQRWDRIQQIAGSYGFKLPDEPVPKPLADFLAARKAADLKGFSSLSFTILKLLGPGEYVVEPPHLQLTGHFGLALDDYSHSTAPNRRFSDLVIQRLLFATMTGAPVPYRNTELEKIARRCTEREDVARKVERFMRKVAAIELIRPRIGETFEAVVTGASPRGTYVRLVATPVEGKVVRGERGIDVGDKVSVRLLATDADRGFIDFERV